MTYNRIIKKKTLGTVISEGKALTLSAATQTDYWKRPDFVADQLRTTLEEAVKNSPGVIPSRAEEVCARWVLCRADSSLWPHKLIVYLVNPNMRATKIRERTSQRLQPMSHRIKPKVFICLLQRNDLVLPFGPHLPIPRLSRSVQHHHIAYGC